MKIDLPEEENLRQLREWLREAVTQDRTLNRYLRAAERRIDLLLAKTVAG